RARASVPSEDLVDDEEDVVTPRQLTERREKLRVVHAHAGGALDEGLDDDGRERVGILLDHRGDRRERALVGVGLGDGGMNAVEEDACERPPEELHTPEAGRAEGVAVEGAGERDEARLPWSAALAPALD